MISLSVPCFDGFDSGTLPCDSLQASFTYPSQLLKTPVNLHGAPKYRWAKGNIAAKEYHSGVSTSMQVRKETPVTIKRNHPSRQDSRGEPNIHTCTRSFLPNLDRMSVDYKSDIMGQVEIPVDRQGGPGLLSLHFTRLCK